MTAVKRLRSFLMVFGVGLGWLMLGLEVEVGTFVPNVPVHGRLGEPSLPLIGGFGQLAERSGLMFERFALGSALLVHWKGSARILRAVFGILPKTFARSTAALG